MSKYKFRGCYSWEKEPNCTCFPPFGMLANYLLDDVQKLEEPGRINRTETVKNDKRSIPCIRKYVVHIKYWLISKLVAEIELLRFQLHLSNSHQFTKVNRAKSKIGSISCGVLQVSCLHPLPFLIYINDLQIVLECDHDSRQLSSDLDLILRSVKML